MATFAFAMWRQKVASDRSAAELREEKVAHSREKALAEETLLTERRKNDQLRAHAAAIPVSVELVKLNSCVIMLREERTFTTPPGEVFKGLTNFFGARNLSGEALLLLDAAAPVLAAVEGAQKLYTYLYSISHHDTFEDRSRTWLMTNALALAPILAEARRAVNLVKGIEGD
ncbi:hypothetical protein ABRP17_016510 [Stenotrophomonas sp. WHRI 8082]|uniref:hypothetical protein n=1 Tax=Stenotrophomonas sp. WHRI 8082 TaxID=3162571 RepID=UPI0032EF7E7F